MTLKRPLAWAAVALLALAAVLLASRSLHKTDKPKGVAPAPVAAELAATDIITLQAQDLQLGLALSGTLKAVNTAMVKARVAGELQHLRVREGDVVSAGQVLARIDPTEYEARHQQAQQQAEAARAQLGIAQRSFDINKSLADRNFISPNAMENSLSNLQNAQANHRAALAAAEVARKALDDTTLRAPLAGQVAQRLAQPGERLAVDTRVLEIVDPQRLELEAAIGAAESLQLKLGQSAELRVEGSAQTVQAKLVRINPSAQAASRSVLAYLSIDKPDPSLRQGLFAEGSLGMGRRQVVALPESALRVDKAQPYVQVLRDGQVAHQPVTPGARGKVDGQAMVEVNLPAGTQVLRASVGPLREGMPVRLTQLPGTATPPAKAAP